MLRRGEIYLSTIVLVCNTVDGWILNGLRPQKRGPLVDSPNFRIPLAFSLVLLLHRFLYRFFVRLRTSLRTDEATPFRTRNPRLARALASRYAPAVGASLAGSALGVCPQKQLRLTAAIWMSTRSLEFLFNVLDEKGWFEGRPRWFGSWLLMPLSCAQLFHAFVFDRETTPKVCCASPGSGPVQVDDGC